jgi:hypothetical protein
VAGLAVHRPRRGVPLRAERPGARSRRTARTFPTTSPACVSADGEQCSFDAFIKHYRLGGDPALERLALIVRGADTGKPDLAPQVPGLLAVSLGLSRNFPDDHEMLKHGMVVYDALYSWCKESK